MRNLATEFKQPRIANQENFLQHDHIVKTEMTLKYNETNQIINKTNDDLICLEDQQLKLRTVIIFINFL